MKLLTYIEQGEPRLAMKTGQGILDVMEALKAVQPQDAAAYPASIMEAILGGEEAAARLGQLAEEAAARHAADGAVWKDESALAFAPCVTQPGKIVCVGLNYRKHAEETKADIPAYPILFNKFNNALTGHGNDVQLPARVSDKVDYEAELAIVIGRTAKDVDAPHALEHVYGYACANDLSARDLQNRTTQWMLGKTCDGFCPLGPYLVTADEVGDPDDLAISCSVNGDRRQSSRTSDMIFGCAEIVSYVSRHMTLQPGDVILTGTPEGVVLGMPQEKRVYLQPGDIVTVEIEKLGALTNRMI
jgi:2-keto-4-pentenoate hydratase/2-oxohepta-3-ene-1,7-dioic acid hydratase in catechol pathway